MRRASRRTGPLAHPIRSSSYGPARCDGPRSAKQDMRGHPTACIGPSERLHPRGRRPAPTCGGTGATGRSFGGSRAGHGRHAPAGRLDSESARHPDTQDRAPRYGQPGRFSAPLRTTSMKTRKAAGARPNVSIRTPAGRGTSRGPGTRAPGGLREATSGRLREATSGRLREATQEGSGKLLQVRSPTATSRERGSPASRAHCVAPGTAGPGHGTGEAPQKTWFNQWMMTPQGFRTPEGDAPASRGRRAASSSSNAVIGASQRCPSQT